MWQWDQGRLNYFQFDTIRKFAEFAVANDLKAADHAALLAASGLDFKPIDPKYPPWRNYSRVFKELLLVSTQDGVAAPTPVAQILSKPGAITSDEYFHFFVRAFTEPSPARKQNIYSADAQFRYPLLFALKYLLAKAAIEPGAVASREEIIAAYETLKFSGDEDQAEYIAAVGASHGPPSSSGDPLRQMKESLLVLCQISYLHYDNEKISLSLDQEDALEMFGALTPVLGPFESDRDAEVRRRASLFLSGISDLFFDYSNSVVADLEERGFPEGTKAQKTHVTIERNRKLRDAFFQKTPTAQCDICKLETVKSYPWTERVLDVHHLLPLASGTKMDADKGTLLDDLVPVCPSCHRATHRFYNKWLKQHAQADFTDAAQAKSVYAQMKKTFPGPHHA